MAHLARQLGVANFASFFTPYCGPSRLMNSLVEQVSNQMKNPLEIILVDSEKYSELANFYHIHALPTLLLFKHGQLVTRIESESPQKIISAELLIEQLRGLI